MVALRGLLLFTLALHVTATAHAQKKDRATQVKDDRAKFGQDKFWIYNNLDSGIAKARKTGRPLLIVFR